MRRIGNDVYIQRGEMWSLDFDVKNSKGDPYMILKTWDNPYLAITVAAALYEQPGDFRITYWLDLSQRWIEAQDGSVSLQPIKKFISTEVLSLTLFSVTEAIEYYGVNNGGKMVLDSNSDFDITNYLFCVDEYSDGNKTYKYVKSYTVQNGEVINEEWEEYNFRVIKQFNTKDWMEQGYLFDMKVLAGESVQEHIATVLDMEGDETDNLPWSDTKMQEYINMIGDEDKRHELQALFDAGTPLMPDYDTKSLILQPTNLYVSVNIQGGVK